jgi:hypothetical protein
LQEHLSGRRERSYELWAILMVSAWLDAVGQPSSRTVLEGLKILDAAGAA